MDASTGDRLKRMGAAALEGFLGLLYPRDCTGCDAPLAEGEGRWLCGSCQERLHRIEPPFCSRCGQTYEGEMSHGFLCANCAGLDLAFDFAVGAYRNEGLARELVHRFKYGREHHLCATLGRLLAAALEEERLAASLAAGERWILVPVPLHRRRMRERQFNQSAELARVLAGVMAERGLRLERAQALRRVLNTRRQASLDRANRLVNLRRAFALARSGRLRKRLAGSSVLLVDDVLTTGATASECARVLREQGGAAKIVVITAVRG